MMMEEKNLTGDISREEFQIYSNEVSKWIGDYLNGIEKYPVLSQISP
jgi:hypothetical protein